VDKQKARWREPAGFGRNFDYGEFIAENFVLNKAGNCFPFNNPFGAQPPFRHD